jgi:hypothetical protein
VLDVHADDEAVSEDEHVQDAGNPTFAKIVAGVLDSGAYDFGRTASAYLANEQTLVVTGSWLSGFIELGLPGYTLDQRPCSRGLADAERPRRDAASTSRSATSIRSATSRS